MTKREQYGLLFNKFIVAGHIFFKMEPEILQGATYANLIFINSLEANEIESFIQTITEIQSGQAYDLDFLYSQGLEVEDVVFDNPNFIIDGVLTIHMQDLKLLLQEWLDFID